MNIYILVLIAVFQISACSLSQQTNSSNSPHEINPITSPTKNKPMTIAEENFAKEWKSKFDETSAKLEHNRNLWKQNQIADYDFVVAKSAGGFINEWNRLPILIKIRDGEKILIEKVEKDKDYVIYSRTDGFEDFDTIDKLFSYLQEELEKGRMLAVKYNKDLGYPKNITIIDSYEIHGYRNIVVEKIQIIKNI